MPVSSRPSVSFAYGDVTSSGTSRTADPVFVIARLVTATFSCVMNFVTTTRRPSPS